MLVTLKHPDGLVHVERLKTGKLRIHVELLNKELFMRVATCDTSYPIELIEQIMNVRGPSQVCDEIMRDESPSYIQHRLGYDLLAYVSEDRFDNKRVLDFGCGAGSSAMILARMFPNTEIVGIELDANLLSIAERRVKHYGFDTVRFVSSPNSDSLPSEIGNFDYVVLSAVYEHLLPNERRTLLPKIWSHLNPGGVLFINGTPHRYFPVETHTAGLPLINYLPDIATLYLARRFSKRVSPDKTWESLLRGGIRGGFVKEIMKILNTTSQKPVLLEPQSPGMKDRIDLWYVSSRMRNIILKKILMVCFKTIKFITGITITPSLSLAIMKSR